MQKRGLSQVITTLAIIFIAIAFVIIVWGYIRPILLTQGESFEIRADLTQEDFEIKRADVDTLMIEDPESLSDPPEQIEIQRINLLIQKQSGEEIEVGEITINTGPESQDIILVTDISGSMLQCDQDPEDLNDAAFETCCNTQLTSDDEEHYREDPLTGLKYCTGMYANSPSEENTLMNKCENTCGGIPRNRMGQVRESQKNLVENLFSGAEGKDVGLGMVFFGGFAGFGGFPGKGIEEAAGNSESNPIIVAETTNIEPVKDFLDSSLEITAPATYDLGAGTCMCGGLYRALDMISEIDESREKTIILMSDGAPTHGCFKENELPGTDTSSEIWSSYAIDISGTPAKNSKSTHGKKDLGYCAYLPGASPQPERLHELEESYESLSSIPETTIHTIGFQVNPDSEAENVLKDIAEEGSGQYFRAEDAEDLTIAYNEVTQKLISTTNYADSILFVIQYKDGSRDTGKQALENTKIYETGEYNIDLSSEVVESHGGLARIEIYPVGTTSSGKEIVGPLLDSYTF